MKICNKCGSQFDDNDEFCPFCGEQAKNSEINENIYSGGIIRPDLPKGLSILGMILGIISIALAELITVSIVDIYAVKQGLNFNFGCLLFVIPVICAIVGLILSIKERIKFKRGINKAGKILSIIGLIACVVSMLVGFLYCSMIGSELERSRELVDISNMRGAKAAAVAAFLADDGSSIEVDGETIAIRDDGSLAQSVYYDAVSGVLTTETFTLSDSYGKGTSTVGGCDEYEYYDSLTSNTPAVYDGSEDMSDRVIEIVGYKDDSTVVMRWMHVGGNSIN